jgi:Na+/H+ antiporter NhaD/arsenite permease-like protein
MLDNFATALSFFSLHTVEEALPTADAYQAAFTTNGYYWKVVAYCAALAGNVLAIGSMSGVALLKMERMPMMWYMKNVGIKALLGWVLGLVIMVFIALWA